MELSKDDVKILAYLCSHPKSTSTEIAKGISTHTSLYKQRSFNSKVIYRLGRLEAMNLVRKHQVKKWEVSDNVVIGESKIVFRTDENELSVGEGLSMLVISGDEYLVIKLEE